MLKKARLAFSGLTDLFNFGDGSALTDVDISAGFATLDGMGPWLRKAGKIKSFFSTEVDGVGTTTVFEYDFTVGTDWDGVLYRGSDNAGTGAQAVDPENDMILLGLGFDNTATANVTSIAANKRIATTTDNFSELLYVADTSLGQANYFHADGPTMQRRFPVWFPGGQDSQSAVLQVRIANSGANTTSIIANVIEFPPGLWVPR